MEILIIGGGASGMAAALQAAQSPDWHVTLLERQARVGRKLLATGNGRCNLSNTAVTQSRYHGLDPAFTAPALARFSPEETLTWFRGLGLLTVREPSGRIYPLSDQANSVVDVLRFALEARGVCLHTGCEVQRIWKKGDGFLVKTPGEEFFANRVIVACGGAAGEKLGGGTGGYRLLKALGHKLTPLAPSLVQLKTDSPYPRQLKGVRVDAAVTLCASGRVLAQSAGEVQFTDYGVSGPAIFEVSRFASPPAPSLSVSLDFFRAYSLEQVLSFLARRQASFPGLASEHLLAGMLHSRLGRVLLTQASLPAAAPASALSSGDLSRLAACAKAFSLPVAGPLGMEQAQVTAGGVPTSEFFPETLESRLVPGLYACGEILDVDGDCGGFNLQWAWSSGRLAGMLLSKEDPA